MKLGRLSNVLVYKGKEINGIRGVAEFLILTYQQIMKLNWEVNYYFGVGNRTVTEKVTAKFPFTDYNILEMV